MSSTGMWQLEPKVFVWCTPMTRSQAGGERPGHTQIKQHQPVPLGHPLSTEISLTTGSLQALPLTSSAWQNQNAHNVSTIPPYPHHNYTTLSFGGWSNTQSPTLHMQIGSPLYSWTKPAIAPGSSTLLTNGLEGCGSGLRSTLAGTCPPATHNVNKAHKQTTAPKSIAKAMPKF